MGMAGRAALRYSTARRVTTWQAYTLSSTVPCMSDARSVDMIALLRCILVRSATSFVSVEAVWPLGAGRLHQIDLRRHTASQPARPAEHYCIGARRSWVFSGDYCCLTRIDIVLKRGVGYSLAASLTALMSESPSPRGLIIAAEKYQSLSLSYPMWPVTVTRK